MWVLLVPLFIDGSWAYTGAVMGVQTPCDDGQVRTEAGFTAFRLRVECPSFKIF